MFLCRQQMEDAFFYIFSTSTKIYRTDSIEGSRSSTREPSIPHIVALSRRRDTVYFALLRILLFFAPHFGSLCTMFCSFAESAYVPIWREDIFFLSMSKQAISGEKIYFFSIRRCNMVCLASTFPTTFSKTFFALLFRRIGSCTYLERRYFFSRKHPDTEMLPGMLCTLLCFALCYALHFAMLCTFLWTTSLRSSIHLSIRKKMGKKIYSSQQKIYLGMVFATPPDFVYGDILYKHGNI